MKTKDWIKQKAVTGAIFLAGLLSFKGGQASAAVPQDNKNKQNITNVQQASLKETGIPAPQFYFETANKLDLNDKSINWVEFSAEEMMSTLNKTEYSDRQKLEIMKYYTE